MNAICHTIKESLPYISCCTDVTDVTTVGGGGRRLQLNNANSTNSRIDVVFDTTIVTVEELSCATCNNTCQLAFVDAINSDTFGDMIGGTVVDLRQLSTKSSKSGTSGGSTKSSNSGTSGGSTKSSKCGTGGSMKSSKSMNSGSSF